MGEAAVCMTDHFDKIQKLPDPIPGCPNFRRVPGFKVYCSGQPTIEGFEKALEKVCGTIYPKDGPIIWFNLRQEPTVYVNGNPICARPANKIGEYAELGAITRDIIKAQETAFLGECEGRKSVGGFLSATPPPPWRLTLTSSARPWSAPPSTPPLLSMTRSASPAQPLAASLPASSRSSRSPPASRALWRLFLE